MAFSSELLARLELSRKQVFNQIQREDRVGSWIYACDTSEYWWSDQVYRIYGLDHKTPLTPALFLDQVHEGDKNLVKSAFEAVMRGKPYHFVHRVRVNGRVKWLEQNGRLYDGKRRAVPYVLGSVRDVTAAVEKERRLEERRADYAAITQYLAETTDTTNIGAIVASAKRTIRRRMDVVIIAVFVREGERVSRVIPQGMDPLQAFLFQQIQDFVGYQAVMEGKRQMCSAANYPTALGRAALEEMGGKSVVALPIKHGGVTIGALSIVTRHTGGLERAEDEFCRTICGYLSNQLNNALLYARLKQELALRVSLESDRDVIFNESVDFISIIDSDGCFTQINPAFAARLGYTQEALMGRSVFDFIFPEDRNYAWQVFSGLAKTGVVRGFRNRFVCQGGEIGYLENNLKYMEDSGRCIAIARDLTGQREMEARNILLEETVAFERTKSEFFAGLSHEFKTPLNIILSTLDLVRLKSRKEDEARFQSQYEKFFEYAYQNCYKLLRLSSNLLDASRMESGYYSLHMVQTRLDALLRGTVEAAEVYANARSVSLGFDGPEAWLACDEDAVERILLNLLSNAIKNNHPGGRVWVTLTEEPTLFRVTVEDNGVGIPAESLPTIFHKFMTSRNPISGQREGSGIGLSLVKSLTELHGGNVTAESQVGTGSRFTFTLARNLAPQREAERPSTDAMASVVRLELSDVK